MQQSKLAAQLVVHLVSALFLSIKTFHSPLPPNDFNVPAQKQRLMSPVCPFDNYKILIHFTRVFIFCCSTGYVFLNPLSHLSLISIIHNF